MSLAVAHEERLPQPLPGQEPLVLVADPIAEEGLAILRPRTRVEIVVGDREALERNLGQAEALLVRSETRVTEAMLDAAPRLRVIGRAGAGVGSEVARRAQGLDMRVIVFDPYVPDEHVQRTGLEPVELETLLASADFVSLHVPLTEATRGILNAERIASMRPGAFIVNCAR